MITINGKEYRNLEEQVLKNMDDIQSFLTSAELLGCKIIGTVATVADLPDASTYVGSYGDCYAVGASSPYDIYVWIEPNQFFNIGKFPLKGDTGATGPAGADGRDGNKIYVTNGAPGSIGDAEEGDIAIDKNSWNVWREHSGIWTLVGNIKGAPGQDGRDGAGLEQIISIANTPVHSGSVTVDSTYVQWLTDGKIDYTDADSNPATQNITIYNRMPLVADGAVTVRSDTDANKIVVGVNEGDIIDDTMDAINSIRGVQVDQGGITVNTSGIVVEGDWVVNYGSGAGTDVYPHGAITLPLVAADPVTLTDNGNDEVEIGLDESSLASDLASDYNFVAWTDLDAMDNVADYVVDSKALISSEDLGGYMTGSWRLMGSQTIDSEVAEISYTPSGNYTVNNRGIIGYRAIVKAPANSTGTAMTGIVYATVSGTDQILQYISNFLATSVTKYNTVDWFNDGSYIGSKGSSGQSANTATVYGQYYNSILKHYWSNLQALKIKSNSAGTTKFAVGTEVSWYALQVG